MNYLGFLESYTLEKGSKLNPTGERGAQCLEKLRANIWDVNNPWKDSGKKKLEPFHAAPKIDLNTNVQTEPNRRVQMKWIFTNQHYEM